MTTYYFYDHVISVESVHRAIDDLELPTDQRVELRRLLEAQVHHNIMNLILSELPPEDRAQFLEYHSAGDSERMWALLSEKIESVEEKIRDVSDELVAQMHKDIADLDSEE
jgi:transposase